jgi:hypothetical protein
MSEEAIKLFGFLSVLIVGIGILLLFNTFEETNKISGGVVFGNVVCKDVPEGINCGGTTYYLSNGDCPQGYEKNCTNACLLENTLYNKNYSCKSSCRFVCLPNF